MPVTPKETATRQFAGLVLTRVKRARLDELRALLSEIRTETIATMKGRPSATPIIPFRELETIHYARFVLLDRDPELGPWLAFSTNYDGPEGEDRCGERRAFAHHVAELVRVAGKGLERVFQHCEGYGPGKLASFIRRKQTKANTFYVASSGRSRNQILWEAELRREVDRLVDAGKFQKAAPEAVREGVRRALAAKYPSVPKFPPQPNLEGRIKLVVFVLAAFVAALVATVVFAFRLSGLSVLAAVAALAALVAWRFRRLELTDSQFQPNYSKETIEHFDYASADENEFLQNQLTHLVRIKPGPIRWALIRVVFVALDVLARYRYNKGKLGGIPSIHFARWVLIPKRGVLFFSNFDSSWQSYLGDFIDQASSGLTAVWSNTVGYPRTTWLLQAGSRDAARFLAWTRHHQLPTQVWYSAYPGLSIVNINANTEIRRGLSDPKSIDAAAWLFRLRSVDNVSADQLYGDQRREPPLPLRDIQGIILWGYGHMPEARYLMFRLKQPPSPSLLAWLAALPLTSAEGSRTERPRAPLVNVAFTHRGLQALGVDGNLCARFSTPFVQGSDHPYRARVNGDVGKDAPVNWKWGSAQNPVHFVLLVFAEDARSVEAHTARFRAEGEQNGLEHVTTLEGRSLADRKEHFGFRDGIAQPVLAGAGRGEVLGNTVAAGEFLLGHRDGYGNVSHSPESSAGFAFGLNGSYLVFRQLEQHVEEFWRYCKKHGNGDAVKTASKLVGRWPSGATLVLHPDNDPNDERFADEDGFSYLANDHDNDRYGARCPFGAHIRRANPRDWQLGASAEESLKLSNLHRILRRGRPYGEPLDRSMSPAGLLQKAESTPTNTPQAERGLQFLCFNANLERQFEFIQQQWCNNPKFAGQSTDADPLLGLRQEAGEIGIDAAGFTIQSDVKLGVEARVPNIERFVSVVGSSYFFMPSIPAVRLLPHVCRPAADLGLEHVPNDEQLHIDGLIESLRNKMKRDYSGTLTRRDAHPKMHGLVQAHFKVEPGLDPSLAVGVFSQPKTYKAWVRFSNQAGTAAPDEKGDIRGAAIKLFDVPGTKLLEGAEGSTTHDFILISTNAFVTKDVAEFDALIRAMVEGTLSLGRFLFSHPRVAYNLFSSLKRHSSPLEIRYFSVVPYLLGGDAVKYSLRPSNPERAPVPRRPEPDYLRSALKAKLSQGPQSFDFLVQPRTRPRKMPIEDPGVAWSERRAPFVKVATLEILRQDFDTPERDELGENLSFNPWRCLAEHRPLGGISRARRQVYRALSAFRHDRNATPSEEPSPW